ncbi:DnaJ family domain-containing protein [Sporosarcina jiandibaonis]|uniref:DnaJ family domain-containing protein n=1 Tax=Sporosarcina jiandibaonis TaxID=2715535 RepID=UPI00155177F3|nr:DnaJ family domain-containing protein [Sporosarcina jiandibaonis]
MKNEKLNPPQYNDLIGDILKKHTADGGMDNLKGAGKPLSKEYFSGDTFQHFQRIAQDAGYKPHWLKLRHEIRDAILSMIDVIAIRSDSELNELIIKINEKINDYNKACPPPLQKGQVSLQTIKAAAEHW